MYWVHIVQQQTSPEDEMLPKGCLENSDNSNMSSDSVNNRIQR